MRLALAIVLGCMLAACGLEMGQSPSERAFVDSEGSRAARAELDARAIMQGMDQARTTNEQVARDQRRGTTAQPLTR